MMADVTTNCDDSDVGVILFDGIGMYNVTRSDMKPLTDKDKRAVEGMGLALRMDESFPDKLKR